MPYFRQDMTTEQHRVMLAELSYQSPGLYNLTRVKSHGWFVPGSAPEDRGL